METSAAKKDFLTGFNTRESLVPAINLLRSSYDTYKKAFSLLILDVDHFKFFNDKYGHLLGDEVLKYFSSSIRLDLVSEQTTLFRFGGDEFLVLFHAADAEESYDLALRLLENIKQRPCNIRGNQLKMSFSAGIASYPQDGWTAEDLLEKADKALYVSKKSGRRCVTSYSQIWQKKIRLMMILVGVALGAALIGIGLHYGIDRKAVDLYRQTPKAVATVETISRRAAAGLKQRKEELSKKFEDFFTVKPSLDKTTPPSFQEEIRRYIDGSGPKLIPPPAEHVENSPKNTSRGHELVYLKNGGVVRGRVVSKSSSHVKVEFDASSGRGTVILKTEDIDRIEMD